MPSRDRSLRRKSLISSPLVRQLALTILISSVLSVAIASFRVRTFSAAFAFAAASMIATPALCFILAWGALTKTISWMSHYFRWVLAGVFSLYALISSSLYLFTNFSIGEAALPMVPAISLIFIVSLSRVLFRNDSQSQLTQSTPSSARLTVSLGATILGFTALTMMASILPALTFAPRPNTNTGWREVRPNIAAIRTAEVSYAAEYGHFVAVGPIPPMPPGPEKRPMIVEGTGFAEIGWEPEGDVYFIYAVTVNDAKTAFTISALSDLDGDGEFNAWGFVKPAVGQSVGIDGYFHRCKATGTYNAVTGENDLTETVGPCDSKSGVSVF